MQQICVLWNSVGGVLWRFETPNRETLFGKKSTIRTVFFTQRFYNLILQLNATCKVVWNLAELCRSWRHSLSQMKIPACILLYIYSSSGYDAVCTCIWIPTIWTLKMEEARSSETTVSTYRCRRCQQPLTTVRTVQRLWLCSLPATRSTLLRTI